MKEFNAHCRCEQVNATKWPLIRALVAAGLASAMLGGCSVLDGNTSNSASNASELKISPLPLITRGDKSPDGYYALGKYYLYQGRLEQAQEAFWDAVRMDPGHVDALNGLGVVYDKLGQYDAARKVYEAALLKDPGASHVWANLGYSMKLAGKNAESIAPLQKAIALDPANSIAQQNLASVEADAATEVSNQPARQEQIHLAVQANKRSESASEKPAANELVGKKVAEPIVSSTLQAVSIPVSSAVAKEAPKPIAQPAVERQVEQTAILAVQPREKADIKPAPVVANVINQSSNDRGIIQHQVSASQNSHNESSVQTANKVSVAKPQIASEVKLVPVASFPDNTASRMLDGLRIEVSNGNGVTGMARAVGTEMSHTGLNVKRITNAKPFNKPQTLIMCRPELKSAAMELAQTMPANPKIVLRDVAHRRVDVRVILGADTAIAWKDGSKDPYLVASLTK